MVGPVFPNKEVKPPPVAQAPAVVVSRPPVLACTQFPEVNALSVTLVPVSAVNDPAAGADPPMAGGEAKYVENPVPLTVLEAERVVNAPVLGVELPMVPGMAQVPASRVVALFVPVPDTVRLLPLGITSAVIVPVDPYTLDTPPPPAPHAPPVVVSNPAVPAWTQLPGVMHCR